MIGLLTALLGVIVGGFFAIWGAKLQFEIQRKRRVQSLSAALSTEIAGLVELARRNRYAHELRAIVAHLQSPAFDGEFPAFVITNSQSYFSVFEANAGDIGELEPKLVVEVIAFYQQGRSWLDSLTAAAMPQAGAMTPNEVISHYTFLADTIERLCQFGDRLAARLAPTSVSGHILATSRALDVNQLGITEHLIDADPNVESAQP